ncbi:MAG: 4-(cytidine 5'-diphospho)-2-C-methyl-D-erythritol kinase [Clostridia bacterium]
MLEMQAYAKINLSLDVLGLRQDGFHEVEMLMQSVSLHDKLSFTLAPELSLTSDNLLLANNQSNLIMQAALLLQKRFMVQAGASIHLQKRIPLGAGLAGGSADAAATLQGLNILWQLGLSQEKLLELAASLGSDVPFCLLGGLALARGRGEKLIAMPALPAVKLLLINPGFSISTPAVYQVWDSKSPVSTHTTEKMLLAMMRGENPYLLAENELAWAASVVEPRLLDFAKQISTLGARKSWLSGSGPSMLLWDEPEILESIYQKALTHYPHVYMLERNL